MGHNRGGTARLSPFVAHTWCRALVADAAALGSQAGVKCGDLLVSINGKKASMTMHSSALVTAAFEGIHSSRPQQEQAKQSTIRLVGFWSCCKLSYAVRPLARGA